jgi:hypothetical protein
MSAKLVTMVVDVLLINGRAVLAEASSDGGPWAYSDTPQVCTDGKWRVATQGEVDEAEGFLEQFASRKARLGRQVLERRLDRLEEKILDAADLAVVAIRSHLDPNDAPHPMQDREVIARLRAITTGIRRRRKE